MSYIPKDHNHVSPYLVVSKALPLIEFLETVFGAEEIYREEGDDGRIVHTEVKIKDSVIMIGEGGEDYDPRMTYLHVYVEDVDESFEKALQSGAREVDKPENKPEGDRRGSVMGPQGNHWSIATKIT